MMAKPPEPMSGEFLMSEKFHDDLVKIGRFHEIMKAKMRDIIRRVLSAGMGRHAAKRARKRAWDTISPGVSMSLGLNH